MRSPFLDIPESRWVCSNEHAFAFRDNFPVAEGHTLVVPRRVIATWWEATREERLAMIELVDRVKAGLDQEPAPDGYNVGFNAGAAAGQTVDHLHIHVIPRRTGDVPDPTGGVRWVIPGRANYKHPAFDSSRDPGTLSLTTGEDAPLRNELLRCLAQPAYDRIDLVVSFIMLSGLQVLAPAIADALDRGAAIRILTTDYLDVTQPDALACPLFSQDLVARGRRCP